VTNLIISNEVSHLIFGSMTSTWKSSTYFIFWFSCAFRLTISFLKGFNSLLTMCVIKSLTWLLAWLLEAIAGWGWGMVRILSKSLITSSSLFDFIWFLYPCRGYIDFSQKFATQWRRRVRPHKIYIFLISMTRRVDLAMSVCPSVRLSVRFYAN